MDGERRNLIPIGQFSLLTRLTVRALRLYDKEGILVPAHVDPDTGYRYYTPEQAQDALHIGQLRQIDLPLDDIRTVLETPVQLTRSLELHASRLRGRRDDAERALDLLRAIQKGIEPLNVPIEVRETRPTRGISIEMKTSIDEIGARFGEAMPRLVEVLHAHGVKGGNDFAAYPDEEFDPQNMSIVIGISTDADIAPQDDGIQIREFGGGRSVVATLEGPYDAMSQTWQEAWAYVAEQGLERRGTAYELYRVGMAESQNPAEFVTDVVIPIA
jgi:DNA-binding transcriptional MerR regulator/DNA gyrase inhibitor GyrI